MTAILLGAAVVLVCLGIALWCLWLMVRESVKEFRDWRAKRRSGFWRD